MNLSKLTEQSKDILIANNTLMGGLTNLQVIEDGLPKKRELVKGQVTLRGNVLFRAGVADMIALVQHGENIKPQDGKFLDKLWTFDHNFRDLAGAAGLPIPPKALKDERLDEADFTSLSSTNDQFLQPKEGTALATGGAGKTDPAFPVYAGAIPPANTPRWQWQWAWNAESKKR